METRIQFLNIFTHLRLYNYTQLAKQFYIPKLTQLGGAGGALVSTVTTQKEDPGFKPVFEGPF